MAAIDAYYDQVLSYGRNRAIILEAPVNDPACILGNALAAHFLCSKDLLKASALLAAAASGLENATSYEKAVYESIVPLVGDERDEEAALSRHCELVKEYPNDLVSLKRAQILCFYMGQPHLSLSLVEQALPHNQDQSFIYGMLAFPLLELGRMAEAKSAARRGLEINRFDIWSQHCVEIILNENMRNKIVKRSMSFKDDKSKKVNRKGSLCPLPYGMEFVSMHNRSGEECVCMYGALKNPTTETLWSG